MAVEVESSGQVEEFLGVLKRRAWFIVLPAAFCIAVGVCFSVLVPKKYVVDTTVIVRNTLQGADRGATGGGNSAREAQVAEQDITAVARIRAVLTELEWPEYLELAKLEQNEYVRDILEGVSVSLKTVPKDAGAQPVTIKFSHTDPARAEAFLNALSQRWQDEVLDRAVNAERKAFDSLKERRGQLQTELENVRTSLTELRTNFGIAPVLPQNLGQNQGPVTDPLFEQIPLEEAALETLGVRITRLETDIDADEKRWSVMSDEREIVESAEGLEYSTQIMERKAQISEKKQTIVNKGYKTASRKRQALEQEIRTLEGEIQLLEENQTQASSTERWVPNEAKFELEGTIAQNKIDLERLKSTHALDKARLEDHKERAVELQDVFSRIEALETDRLRATATLTEVDASFELADQRRTWLEGPGGNPFAVLSPVELPTVPTEPNPTLIIAFAVFLGLAIGFGLAVLTEYSKNCFRSVHDISRVMMIPVLGTINAIRTRAERRRSLIARFLLVGTTFTIIGLMGYVTWAWRFETHRLSDRMVSAIEAFRESFK